MSTGTGAMAPHVFGGDNTAGATACIPPDEWHHCTVGTNAPTLPAPPSAIADALAQAAADALARATAAPARPRDYVVVRDGWKGTEYLKERDTAGVFRTTDRVELALYLSKAEAENEAALLGRGWRVARPSART